MLGVRQWFQAKHPTDLGLWQGQDDGVSANKENIWFIGRIILLKKDSRARKTFESTGRHSSNCHSRR